MGDMTLVEVHFMCTLGASAAESDRKNGQAFTASLLELFVKRQEPRDCHGIRLLSREKIGDNLSQQ